VSPSGAQLEEARIQEKLAALPLLIRDPVRARREETHHEAHGQLYRVAMLDRIGLTARRARNRQRQLRILMALLNRTDHVHEGVPCREEREALIGPILKALTTIARRPTPKRTRATTSPAQETRPMPTETRQHGQLRDERPEETAARLAEAANGHHSAAGLPLDLANEVADWQRNFLAPNFSAVRVAKCERLARYLLDRPPAAQRELLARLLYTIGMEGRR
jgi:hypothetical protein